MQFCMLLHSCKDGFTDFLDIQGTGCSYFVSKSFVLSLEPNNAIQQHPIEEWLYRQLHSSQFIMMQAASSM